MVYIRICMKDFAVSAGWKLSSVHLSLIALFCTCPWVYGLHVLLWTSVGFLPACWYQLQKNLDRWDGWGKLQTKALEHCWHSGNLVSVSPKAVRSQLELKHLRASKHRFKVQTNTCLRAPCGDGRWAKTKRDLVNIPSLSGRKNRFAWDGMGSWENISPLCFLTLASHLSFHPPYWQKAQI